MHRIYFRPGFRPDPAGGTLDALPDLVIGWGGGHPNDPPPHSLPMGNIDDGSLTVVQ